MLNFSIRIFEIIGVWIFIIDKLPSRFLFENAINEHNKEQKFEKPWNEIWKEIFHRITKGFIVWVRTSLIRFQCPTWETTCTSLDITCITHWVQIRATSKDTLSIFHSVSFRACVTSLTSALSTICNWAFPKLTGTVGVIIPWTTSNALIFAANLAIIRTAGLNIRVLECF